ncbi:chemotaxis protein CheW [Viridibacillus arvi]|uniref:chemotaxis protein CheW n=1 Tax=Viridibacillus arvi TaxID=263475 RepID=UPI003D053A0D
MSSSKVVVFRCGQEEYAVPIDHVVSIEKMEHVNPIPHLPSYVTGLMRMRGELMPILDFEQILYRGQAAGDQVRIVVLQTGDFLFGLLVVEAKEILDIPAEHLQQIGLVNYSKTKYFTAVANLEERMITIVSPSVLVDSLEGIKEIKAYMQKLKEDERAAKA